jgi:hypothetical protein
MFANASQNWVSCHSKKNLLNDPKNIWIGDTGETTHQTCHDIGLMNEKEANENDAIIMGNGTNEIAAKQADLPCIVCNKEGQGARTSGNQGCYCSETWKV